MSFPSVSIVELMIFAVSLAALGAFLIAELRAMKKMGNEQSQDAARYAIPWKAVIYAPVPRYPLFY